MELNSSTNYQRNSTNSISWTGMSSKPRVVKAQIKRTKSYTESIVNGVSTLTSWVTGNSPTITQEKDIISTAKFVDIELIPNQMTPCLVIGYNNGFQIWDLSATNKPLPDNTIVEICSVQGFRVRDVCVFNRLKNFSENQEDKKRKLIANSRPLLGIFSAEDNSHEHWPNTRLQLYSILNGTFLTPLEFGVPIINVLHNERFVIVVFRDHASLLSPVTFERQYYIPLYSGDGSICSGVAALGHRWFAYQCRQPLEDTMAATRLSSSTSKMTIDEEHTEILSGRRRKQSRTSYIASSDQVLWAMGNTIVDLSSSIRSISSLWPSFKVGLDVRGSEGHSSPREDVTFKEVGGYVIIIDLEYLNTVDQTDVEEKNRTRWHRDSINNFKLIAHFKATTDSALAVIKFDPTGTLLATASERGNVVNIFKINPNPTDIFDSHQHIYILKRGVTPAIIKQITFSTDSKLVAVTSAYKGTSHIYGINPQGGVVDAISHLDSNNQRRSVNYHYSGSNETSSYIGKLTDSYAPKLSVIRTSNYIPGQEQIVDDPDNMFGSCVYFESRTSKDYILYSLESTGALVYNRIILSESESNPLVLAANAQGVVEWDLRRVTKARPYNFKLAGQKVNLPSSDINFKQNHKAWLSNIEINTCTMPHVPFWLADDLFPLQAYVSLPTVDDPSRLSDPVYQDQVYSNTELVSIPTSDPSNKRPIVTHILTGEQPPLPVLPVQPPHILIQPQPQQQAPAQQQAQGQVDGQGQLVYPPVQEGEMSVSMIVRRAIH